MLVVVVYLNLDSNEIILLIKNAITMSSSPSFLATDNGRGPTLILWMRIIPYINRQIDFLALCVCVCACVRACLLAFGSHTFIYNFTLRAKVHTELSLLVTFTTVPLSSQSVTFAAGNTHTIRLI